MKLLLKSGRAGPRSTRVEAFSRSTRVEEVTPLGMRRSPLDARRGVSPLDARRGMSRHRVLDARRGSRSRTRAEETALLGIKLVLGRPLSLSVLLAE